MTNQLLAELEMANRKLEEKDKEIERLNNIINETLEIVCCIEHNLDKYEEIGGDHLEYATNKVYELKDYLIEELKEGDNNE